MAITLLSYTFTLLFFCLACTLISALYLFVFGHSSVNAELKHPYLNVLPWQRLSLGNRTGILLDYFFRVFFPNTRWSLIGHANQQLAHVNPSLVSLKTKAPLTWFMGRLFCRHYCYGIAMGINPDCSKWYNGVKCLRI